MPHPIRAWHRAHHAGRLSRAQSVAFVAFSAAIAAAFFMSL